MTTHTVRGRPSPLTGMGGRATRPSRALDCGRVGLLGLLALVTLLALPGRGPAEARAADDGAVRALVHGPVDSRVFARLAPHLRLTPYSGQERAEEFDVVVLDGRTFTPDQVAQLALVDEALSAGTWVLLLNPTAAHKSEGLWERVHFATPGRTAAVMVRQRRSETGAPIFDIHEPISAQLAGEDDRGATEPPPRRVLRETQDAALADHLTHVLTTPDGDAGDAAPPPADTAIPPGLLHVQWHYTRPAATTFNSSFYRRGEPVQTTATTINLTFSLFLNNGRNVTGDFQYLLCQVGGTTNPVARGSAFYNRERYEQAWFQDYVHVTQRPSQAGLLTWVASDPRTPNAETTYTASSEFTVNFTNPKSGGGISWTYSNSESYTIRDWGVLSRGAGSDRSWLFGSTNPPTPFTDSPSASNWTKNDRWFDLRPLVGSGNPRDPNALSTSELQFHTSVVYRTSQVETGGIAIDTNLLFRYLDLWCAHRTLGCVFQSSFFGQDAAWFVLTVPHNITLNFAAVVPVPIASLHFSAGNARGAPAPAGDPVTGTVTLDRAAPINTVIYLSSNNTQSASVPPSVTIPQGQQHATFRILTSPSGGPSGSVFSAVIQASDPLTVQEQLWLQN